MAQTGLHTFISFKIFKKPIKKQWFLYSFLLGSILPDLDLITSFLHKSFILITSHNYPTKIGLITNQHYFINYDLNIFHSLITASLLYLIILIFYEIKKSKSILNFANGLLMGILLHVLIDVFLFLRPVQIFWPLNIAGIKPIDLWGATNIPFIIFSLYLSLEFIFFRYIASKIIEIILSENDSKSKYILITSKWMKYQIYLFIFFAISINLSKYNTTFFVIYNIALSICILTTLYLLYVLRNTINNYALNYSKTIIKNTESSIKSTSIDNIG